MPDDLSQEDIDALLTGALPGSEEAQQKAPAAEEPAAESQTYEMPSFDAEAGDADADVSAQGTFDLLMDVNLNVKIELGKSKMLVEDILALKKGSVVPLDKLAGDPVDILVNDRLVARGDVMVINDVFCVRVTEILSPKQRLIALK